MPYKKVVEKIFHLKKFQEAEQQVGVEIKVLLELNSLPLILDPWKLKDEEEEEIRKTGRNKTKKQIWREENMEANKKKTIYS